LARWCAIAVAALLPTVQAAAPAETSPTTYLVVFRPGPQWLPGKPLREHGAYMLDLYRRGVLKHAGGFMDDSGGAMVFEAADEPAARELIIKDPAVAAGVFQLQRWRLVDWEARSKRSMC
jgi:hypothetical protein